MSVLEREFLYCGNQFLYWRINFCNGESISRGGDPKGPGRRSKGGRGGDPKGNGEAIQRGAGGDPKGNGEAIQRGTGRRINFSVLEREFLYCGDNFCTGREFLYCGDNFCTGKRILVLWG